MAASRSISNIEQMFSRVYRPRDNALPCAPYTIYYVFRTVRGLEDLRLHLSKVSTDKSITTLSPPLLCPFQIPTENLPTLPFQPLPPISLHRIPHPLFRLLIVHISASSLKSQPVVLSSPRKALGVHVVPALKDERVAMVMRGVWSFVSFSRVEADVFFIGLV